jgi:hypothetical protein
VIDAAVSIQPALSLIFRDKSELKGLSSVFSNSNLGPLDLL